MSGSIPKTDKPQSISNGHNNPSSSSSVKPKKELEEQDVVTLNSDDSDFEIEYSSQGRGQNSNGGTQTIDDSDDDIQVLEENIKVNHEHTPEKLMMTSMKDRRKTYQEHQQNQKTEVNLSVPVVKGLTPGVYRGESKDKIGDVKKEGSGDESSSSQNAVIIDEDVVMEELAKDEMGVEEDEVDGDRNSNCSSGSGSVVKPNDEDVDYKATSRKTINRVSCVLLVLQIYSKN